MLLYIGGETDVESRFSNLETGSKYLPCQQVATSLSSNSHSNPYGVYQWARRYHRESILWR